MPVSAKGEYAARALLYLALESDAHKPIRTAEIAERENIPKKYLEQILLVFKRAGIVGSKPGLNGGYFLAKPPREISMADVIRAVDGPLAPMRCVSETAYSPCPISREPTCALRTVWQEARGAMVGVLERTTLEDLAARSRALAEASVATYQI